MLFAGWCVVAVRCVPHWLMRVVCCVACAQCAMVVAAVVGGGGLLMLLVFECVCLCVCVLPAVAVMLVVMAVLTDVAFVGFESVGRVIVRTSNTVNVSERQSLCYAHPLMSQFPLHAPWTCAWGPRAR